jgi:hypothetical protein
VASPWTTASAAGWGDVARKFGKARLLDKRCGRTGGTSGPSGSVREDQDGMAEEIEAAATWPELGKNQTTASTRGFSFRFLQIGGRGSRGWDAMSIWCRGSSC